MHPGCRAERIFSGVFIFFGPFHAYLFIFPFPLLLAALPSRVLLLPATKRQLSFDGPPARFFEPEPAPSAGDLLALY